jgi:hypothetical protein
MFYQLLLGMQDENSESIMARSLRDALGNALWDRSPKQRPARCPKR